MGIELTPPQPLLSLEHNSKGSGVRPFTIATTAVSINKPLAHDSDEYRDGCGGQPLKHHYPHEHNADGYGVDLLHCHYAIEHTSDGYGVDPLNHHYPLHTIQIDIE